MNQNVLLDAEETEAVLNCLRQSRSPDSFRLISTIERKAVSTPLMDKIRQDGIDNYTEEGVVEIDDGAIVSIDDKPGAEPNGAYVMGWVWVEIPDDPEGDK